MVLCEDRECSVCFSPYSRMDRIPRVLHCRHTFCDPCLETMSQARGGLLTVGCPLCRRVTCIGRGLSLQKALWVNSKLWEQIPEDEDEATAAEEQRAAAKRTQTQQQQPQQQEGSVQAEWSSRTKHKFCAFFRRFSLTKHPQERIVPGCNVEMKSWRRLPTEETI